MAISPDVLARFAASQEAEARPTPSGPAEWLRSVLPVAEAVADEYGLPVEGVLAQAALESGYGKHAPGNNLFGIKSHGKGGQSQRTQEFIDGRMQTVTDSFRDYGDIGESFRDYGEFIHRNPRYRSALAQDDPEAYVSEIARAGYATDPAYADKLVSIIRGPAMREALGDRAPRPARSAPQTSIPADVLERFRASQAQATEAQPPEDPYLALLRARQANVEPEGTGVVEAAKIGGARGLAGLASAVGTGLRFLGAEDLGGVVESYWDDVAAQYETPEDLQGNVLDDPALLGRGAWWAMSLAETLPSFAATMVGGVGGGAAAVRIGGAAMKLTPQLVSRLARIGGAVGSGATGGSLEGLQTYKEVLERGGSVAEAKAAGGIMGLASAGLNALAFDRITGPAKNRALAFLQGYATEGATELAEEPVEGAILQQTSVARPEDDPLARTRAGFNVAPVAGLLGGAVSAATYRRPGDVTEAAPEIEGDQQPEAAQAQALGLPKPADVDATRIVFPDGSVATSQAEAEGYIDDQVSGLPPEQREAAAAQIRARMRSGVAGPGLSEPTIRTEPAQPAASPDVAAPPERAPSPYFGDDQLNQILGSGGGLLAAARGAPTPAAPEQVDALRYETIKAAGPRTEAERAFVFDYERRNQRPDVALNLPAAGAPQRRRLGAGVAGYERPLPIQPPRLTEPTGLSRSRQPSVPQPQEAPLPAPRRNLAGGVPGEDRLAYGAPQGLPDRPGLLRPKRTPQPQLQETSDEAQAQAEAAPVLSESREAEQEEDGYRAGRFDDAPNFQRIESEPAYAAGHERGRKEREKASQEIRRVGQDLARHWGAADLEGKQSAVIAQAEAHLVGESQDKPEALLRVIRRDGIKPTKTHQSIARKLAKDTGAPVAAVLAEGSDGVPTGIGFLSLPIGADANESVLRQHLEEAVIGRGGRSLKVINIQPAPAAKAPAPQIEAEATTTETVEQAEAPAPPVAPKKAPAKPRKSPSKRFADAGKVRPEDTILTAIARLGGLDRAEAEAQGVDPAHFSLRPVFGRPAFRKTGGLSFDAMAEQLSQHGYFEGDYSANALLDKVDQELRGEPVYSARGVELAAERDAQEREAEADSLDPRDIASDDLEASGYNDLEGETDRAIADLRASATPVLGEEQAGAIAEDVATRFGEASDAEYIDALRSAYEDAIARTTEEGARGRPADGPPGQAEAPLLATYDEAELAAREDEVAAAAARREAQRTAEAERAKADRERADFALTGSTRDADANPGQADLIDATGRPRSTGGPAAAAVRSEAQASEPEAAPAPTPAPVDDLIPIAPGDISRRLAEQAHAGTSFTPERRAQQEQDRYVEDMRAIVSDLRDEATTPEALEVLRDALPELKQTYITKKNAELAARSRTLSSMITGPANFPTRRNDKANATADRRTEDFLEWRKRAIKRLRGKIQQAAGTGPIRSDDPRAPERLRAKIERLEQAQETMKAANRIIRADKDVETKLADLGMTPAQIKDAMTPDFMGRGGFPPYALQNNLAEIKRARGRLASVEAEPAAEADGGETTVASYDGARIVNNRDAERVQIFFDAKPEAELRAALKAQGWMWSRKNGAWQRKNTPQAETSARSIVAPRFEAAPEGRDETDTDEGEPRFSKRARVSPNGKPRGVSRRLVDDVVLQFQAQFHKGAGDLRFRVYDKQSDVPWMGSLPAGTRVKASVSNSGIVSLIAENLDSKADVYAQIRHEVIAHVGLPRLLGEGRWNEILDDVAAAEGRDALMSAVYAEVRGDYPELDGRALADEVLARIAERTDRPVGAFREILAKLIRMLRKIGFWTQPLSVQEVRALLTESARNLRRTPPRNAKGQFVSRSNATRSRRDAVAWHGSAADFDRFDLHAINTGEGNQMFGWGMYFASNRAVAEFYRNKLRTADSPGRLYKVDIAPKHEEYLDWDTFVSDGAPETVAKAQRLLDDEGLDLGQGVDQLGQAFYQRLASKVGGPEAASRLLAEYGIPGIAYLDQGSRDNFDGEGTGTYNYVVFDDRVVAILDRFSKRSAAGAPRADLDAGQRRSVGEFFSDLSADTRKHWFGTLTRQQVVDIASDVLPEAKAWERTAQRMDADKTAHMVDAGETAQRWGDLTRKSPEIARRLADLMHEATVAGIDPSKPKAPDADAPTYNALSSRYKTTLNDDARALFNEVRDAYEKRWKETYAAMKARVERSGADGESKRAMLTKLRIHFESSRVKGPYFPLARFGDYWVRLTKEGAEPEFAMFETSAEQREFMRSARVRGLEAKGWAVDSGKSLKSLRAASGPSAAFVADLHEVVDGVAEGDQARAIKDGIYQLYLESLPELSVRKHAMHRSNRKGFSRDALRAFASQMWHGSNQLARLKHGDVLADGLATMRDSAKELDSREARNKAADVVKELDSRLDWMMNPKSATWASDLTSLGFVYYLGVSPAAGLVNLTQTAIVALPVLASRAWGGKPIGAARAGRALTAGLRDYTASRFSNAARKRLESEHGGDLGKALSEAEESGVLERTLAHSLAGLSETEASIYREGRAKAMGIVAKLFHESERANREAGFIAAYRLARQGGQSHAQAMEGASDFVLESHFDYSSANRARFMQGNAARVLLLFRQYSQNMTYLLWRNFYQAMKGESPEVKQEARTKLFGVLGMTSLFAGAAGLPLMGVAYTVANLAAAAFGDEDDAWDAELAWRQFLAENLPEGWGDVAAKGPVNALTGLDLSSRTSLDELWVRTPYRELEGKALVGYWLEQAAGPVAGIAMNLARGAELYGEGKAWRAVETAVPKFAKDVMKAYRYSQEGALNLKGDPVLERSALGPWNQLWQAGGLSPAELNERYDQNSALKKLEQRIKDRRRSLINAWVMARTEGDRDGMDQAREAIRRFNRANRAVAITGETLSRSLAGRARASQESREGTRFDRRLRQRIEGEAYLDG